jgi:Spy/CpxP family protein refolding chaperone
MKTVLFYIAIFLISASSFGQANRERIKALKIAHITEKLNLTEKEAQQFWPVYNAFDNRQHKIKFGEMREIRHEIREKFETLSETEASNLLEKIMDAENRLHQNKIEFNAKLKGVIPAKKIILLKVAEEEFNRKILEEMKKRRQERMKKNKP